MYFSELEQSESLVIYNIMKRTYEQLLEFSMVIRITSVKGFK